MWHNELHAIGIISLIKFGEDGSFVCEFTYTDKNSKSKKTLQAASKDLSLGMSQ